MANAVEIKLPELGDGISSADVLEVLVKVGDVIKNGQDIIEFETDKATMTIPTSSAGKVAKILVKSGDTVPIGGVLIEVETEGGGSPARAAAPAAAKAVEPVPAPVDPAPSAPAPSAPAPAPAPSAPAPAPPAPVAVAAPTAPVPVGDPPAPVAVAPTTPVPVRPPAAVVPPATSAAPMPVASTSDESIPAGPSIRRLAREVGINLSSVAGTGDGGRITRDDVLSVVRQASQAIRSAVSSIAPQIMSAPAAAAATPAASATATANDDFGPIRVERMTKIRKTIAAQMHASWSTVPRVTNFDDADITDLEHLRQASKDDYAAQGLKLTTMPFLIKAIATALKHHPDVNASIDSENSQIIYKEYVNIGVAVDTERGLVVPVLRNVDRMGIPEIARALAELAGKVRGGQFAVSELRGGTFTLSNLGTIGGQYSTPIVNVPEVAILLVGRSRKLPVVMPDDSIKPRLMMPLSLAYDHRLVDGGTAARFLNDVIGYLEAPSRLLLAL